VIAVYSAMGFSFGWNDRRLFGYRRDRHSRALAPDSQTLAFHSRGELGCRQVGDKRYLCPPVAQVRKVRSLFESLRRETSRRPPTFVARSWPTTRSASITALPDACAGRLCAGSIRPRGRTMTTESAGSASGFRRSHQFPQVAGAGPATTASTIGLPRRPADSSNPEVLGQAVVLRQLRRSQLGALLGTLTLEQPVHGVRTSAGDTAVIPGYCRKSWVLKVKR
jgi:hypothetical protein